MEEKIKKLFELAVANKATDLHLVSDRLPKLRVDAKLVDITSVTKLTSEMVESMVLPLLDEVDKKKVKEKIEVDFSFSSSGARFRVNVYYQNNSLAAAFRIIPEEVPDFETLGLPSIFNSLVGVEQGFVLVTGPTGSGKSTTVASVLDRIAKSRQCHIVTIEDPIEYLINDGKSVVTQREVGGDTRSFPLALRSVLRQDPDVVFVGEMRDLETIASALTVAETGHLVFSTLHTNSAAQSIDRIVDVFPDGSKGQIRLQLASVISAVVSERLLPAIGGGVIPAFEVMTGTSAVKNAIRESKSHMIDNIIQTSADVGMVTLESYLARLVKEGKVEEEVAMRFCIRPSELQSNLRSSRL